MNDHIDNSRLLAKFIARNRLKVKFFYCVGLKGVECPPCTEGVLWMVMKNPVTVSEEQVKQLAEALGHPYNRPILQ
jgi:carbonic anhydrase